MQTFLKRITPAPGKGICPYLGMQEDPQTCLAYPSEWNLCQHARPAGMVKLEYQRSTCLLSVHTVCPVFVEEGTLPLPPNLRRRRKWLEPRKVVRGAIWFLVLVILLLALWWLNTRFGFLPTL